MSEEKILIGAEIFSDGALDLHPSLLPCRRQNIECGQSQIRQPSPLRLRIAGRTFRCSAHSVKKISVSEYVAITAAGAFESHIAPNTSANIGIYREPSLDTRIPYKINSGSSAMANSSA